MDLEQNILIVRSGKGNQNRRTVLPITVHEKLMDHLAEIKKIYQMEKGDDIRTVQELLGHKNLQTTMIYTHVAKKNIFGVKVH